jgi:hypothetical protein
MGASSSRARVGDSSRSRLATGDSSRSTPRPTVGDSSRSTPRPPLGGSARAPPPPPPPPRAPPLPPPDDDFTALARARFAALGREGAWAAGGAPAAAPDAVPAAALRSALGPSLLGERLVDLMAGGGASVTFEAFLAVAGALRVGAPVRARADALLALCGGAGGVLSRGALRSTLKAVLAERGIVPTADELAEMAVISFADVGEPGLHMTAERLAAHLERCPRALEDLALKG